MPLDFPSTYLADAAQDLRVAMRRTRRAPALATAIVFTIALGLGAAAAIFTTSEAARRIPHSSTGDRVPRASAPSRATTRSTRPPDWATGRGWCAAHR